MRVAFFSDSCHPNTQNWLEDLVGLFGVEVHSVDFVAPELPCPRIEQHVVKAALSGKLRFLSCNSSLRRVLRRIRPDLVVGYRITSYGFAAAVAGFHPLVLVGQGSGVIETSPPGSRWCARYALRRANLIHAWAQHTAEAMVRLGADPARIEVRHRGIRTDVYRPGDARPDALRIVTSRQLRPSYRTALIIQALAEIRAGGIPAELLVCGDGPDRESLKRLAANLGLGKAIRFLGRLGSRELAETYRRSSVYASMVPRDCASSSLLEAMSSGLIPVVPDIEANRVWIDGSVKGHLVPPGNLRALTEALQAALQSARSTGRAELSNREPIVRLADRKTNMKWMVELWRELIERNRAAGGG